MAFFANGEADPSGFGEGELYLGQAQVTTDAAGYAAFILPFAPPALPQYCLSATATDPAGNTSEFSACLSVDQFDGFGGGDLPAGLRLGASPAYGLPDAAVPQRQRAEAAAWRLPDFGFDVLRADQEVSAATPLLLRAPRDWQNGSPGADHAALDQLALEWLGDE